ncbi:phosphatase PAP2 family protein [Anaerosinus sp.]
MVYEVALLDTKILFLLQEQVRNEYLTPVFKLITHSGDMGIIWIISAIVLSIYKKTRTIGILAFMAMLLYALIGSGFLKNIVQRTRPFDALEGLSLLTGRPSGYSFPSGHTGIAFAAAGIYLRYLPLKYGIGAMVLAGLMGFSRLYLGAHYPSDVIIAAFIGSVSALLIIKLSRYINEKTKFKYNKVT